MEDDKELEFLKIKKLFRLKKQLESKVTKEKSARELLVDRLVDRGVEVLELAEAYFPKETGAIVNKLAHLIKNGIFKDYISGGELLWLFRRLGINVRIETTINVEKDGKIVPLAERLRSEKEISE